MKAKAGLCVVVALASTGAMLGRAAARGAPPSGVTLHAGDAIDFAIGGDLSSRTVRIDDMFPIATTRPVSVSGRIVIPVGQAGEGQVIHAAKAGGLGRAGELLLAARYIQCGSARIALRGFRLGAGGADHADAALLASSIVPLSGLLVKGGEISVPKGTAAHAKVAEDIAVPAGCGR